MLTSIARIASTDPVPQVRWAAVHTFTCHPHAYDATALLLERVADDPDPSVRGHGLEALAMRWAGASRHAARFPAVRDAVIRSLGSLQGEVRFWALYAVATLDLQDLRPLVASMVDDPAMGMDPYTVGEEAHKVLVVLDTGDWPDDDEVC